MKGKVALSAEASFLSLLSNIVDNRGRTCPTADGGIPLIATNCIRNDLLYPAFEKVRYVSPETYETWFRGHPLPGDIVFVTKGTPGRAALVPDPVPFCIAQDMVAVRADPHKVYPKYLFAVLRSPSVQTGIENMHVGSLIPHFKKGDFDKLLIPVPSRKEQEFVGDLYFELSAKIDLNRRMNETLEELARTIFKSWFVDFDPVKAKAEGQKPEGMDDETAALFPSRFVESELGMIPEGWVVSSLGAMCKRSGGDIQTGPFGSQLHASDYVEEGVPSIMPKDLKEDRISQVGIARIREEDAQRLSRYRLRTGDIVYSRRGDVERCALVTFREEGWLCGTGCLRVRPGPGGSEPVYLFAAVTTSQARSWVVRHAHGATMPNLNTQILGLLPLIEPPCVVQTAYRSLAGTAQTRRDCNWTQNETLAELRDLLLPKLVSGELRITDTDRILAEAGV